MNEWKDARAIPSARLAIHAHLFTDRSCHGDREGPDIATTQVFTFPLVAEELQLPLLFLIQGVAIANLDRHRGWHAGVTLAPEGSWSPGLRLCSLNTLPFGFTVFVGTWTPPGWGLFQWVSTWDCWPSKGLPKGSKLQSPILGQANEWSATVPRPHGHTLLTTLRATPSGIALLLSQDRGLPPPFKVICIFKLILILSPPCAHGNDPWRQRMAPGQRARIAVNVLTASVSQNEMGTKGVKLRSGPSAICVTSRESLRVFICV